MRTTFRKLLPAILLACLTLPVFSQQNGTAVLNADQGKFKINRHIYGHFAEHLGRCIYGGIWVGENSPIPNIRGFRTDIVEALKQIRVPNLRWPGGCFADEYHWMDGIGPREKRPKMINTHWGGVVEDNSFGTHEFMDFCELIGTEPYICGNVGSGSVKEMSQWIEYMTFDGESPMANLRRQNGRDKPWKLTYFAVGNENWGCGGNMSAEGYSENYRRYATFIRNYGENRIFKVAGGPNEADYRWTDVLMRNIPIHLMQGLSLHNYTFTNSWTNKGNATGFTEDDYFNVLANGAHMDEIITRHIAIMDQHDPRKRVALVVDEWGAWYNVEPGTNPGFLYQQNTLRDALLAGKILHIFHKHAERVQIANIAQMVNVLQAIILTEGEKMVLTPTYHIFDMYKVHQDAISLPITVNAGEYTRGRRSLPRVSTTASMSPDGTINISFVNIDPHNAVALSCDLRGTKNSKIAKAQIITGAKIDSHNTFDKPNEVVLADFRGASIRNGMLSMNIPAKSVITVQIR